MSYVIDTNVLVSATRSKRGASYIILCKMIQKEIKYYLSDSLLLEYESVLKREEHLVASGLGENDINSLLYMIANNCLQKTPFYTWRPQLKDPKDEMVLDLAVAAQATIVTHNLRDFKAISKFGLQAIEPREVLKNEQSNCIESP